MKKLDESKVRWIVLKKRQGRMTSRQIIESMGVSVIWVKKLWARYRHGTLIVYPGQTGRPAGGLAGRREHSAVLSTCGRYRYGAVRIEGVIQRGTGIQIPHGTMHVIMRENGLVARHPRKERRRKWVRYERTYPNSMWHTDYKQLDDGRWFIAYQDDASRFITRFGVFDHATATHAIDVLRRTIKDHDRPASVLTDHGTQFYANSGEYKRKGASAFETELASLAIKHILARVGRPQTNGKLERFHGELRRKLHLFKEESSDRTVRRTGSDTGHIGAPLNTSPKKDAITRFIEWYNYTRPHMSLDLDNLETPAQAFARKMPPPGQTVIDRQTGEEYDVS